MSGEDTGQGCGITAAYIDINHQQPGYFENKRKYLAIMYKAHFIKSQDNIFVRNQAIQ